MAMNSTSQLNRASAQDADSPHLERLYAITGILWGSLLGGTCWLVVLALIFTG
jgi:hypothetical protein